MPHDNTPKYGDSNYTLLLKLTRLFGAEADPLDTENRLLTKILAQANAAQSGQSVSQLEQELAAAKNVAEVGYGFGGVYTMTATSAAVTYSTTQPEVTLPTDGTYLLLGQGQIALNSANYATTQTAQIRLRRTNNTPANLPGAFSILAMPTGTSLVTFDNMTTPVAIYQGNAGDVIRIFANVSALPSSGTVSLEGGTTLTAIRLFTS